MTVLSSTQYAEDIEKFFLFLTTKKEKNLSTFTFQHKLFKIVHNKKTTVKITERVTAVGSFVFQHKWQNVMLQIHEQCSK